MARVFGVTAAATALGSMQRLPPSQSTRTALHPAIQIASAVAKKVFALVMTSSPALRPRAIIVSQIASVPLPTPIACFLPV